MPKKLTSSRTFVTTREKNSAYSGTLSPNQVASMLGITGEAVKQWIYQRNLPAVKLPNGYWKVQAADLQRFIEARSNPKAKILSFGLDSPSIDTASEVLAKNGFELIIATGLDDAVLKAQRFQPSLVLADSSHVDSWRLMKKLRALKSLRAIRMIVLSEGQLEIHKAEEALSLELHGCIPKPLDAEIFEREMKLHLKLV